MEIEKPPVLSDEQIVEDMVERYRKWDARGTPDRVIMNKILTNIKPLIAQQAKAEIAREIFEEIEKASTLQFNSAYGVKIFLKRWQSLKDRFLKEGK